jgi:hypothetical protein
MTDLLVKLKLWEDTEDGLQSRCCETRAQEGIIDTTAHPHHSAHASPSLHIIPLPTAVIHLVLATHYFVISFWMTADIRIETYPRLFPLVQLDVHG